MERELNDLINFTYFHFEAEEELLNENNYPILSEHKEMHNALLEKVNNFKDLLFTESFEEDKLIALLRDWILVHIYEEDKKYALFLNEKGVF